MPETDAITIEMEPVRGGQEYGAAQPEPQQALEGKTFDAELVESTNQFLQRAADRADDDRREDLTRKQKQQWDGLVAGGAGLIALSARQQTDDQATLNKLPVAELSRDEIITEARGVRARLDDLAAKLDEADEAERLKVRDEMKPLAKRENELRDEYFERPREQVISESWLGYEAMRIRQEASTSVFETQDEANLAAAYYNGRRETFNSALENFSAANPDAAERLPAAISIDEVQVRTREQALETPSMEIGV